MANKEAFIVPLLVITIVAFSIYAVTLITEGSNEPPERIVEVTEWPTPVYSIDTTIFITPEEAKQESEELIRIANEEAGVKYMLGLEGQYLFKYRPFAEDEPHYENEELRKKIDDLVNRKRKSEIRRQIVNSRQMEHNPKKPMRLAPDMAPSFSHLPSPRQTYKLDGISFEVVSDAQKAAEWGSLQEHQPAPYYPLRGSESYHEIDELREEIDDLNDEIEDLRSEVDKKKRRN